MDVKSLNGHNLSRRNGGSKLKSLSGLCPFRYDFATKDFQLIERRGSTSPAFTIGSARHKLLLIKHRRINEIYFNCHRRLYWKSPKVLRRAACRRRLLRNPRHVGGKIEIECSALTWLWCTICHINNRKTKRKWLRDDADSFWYPFRVAPSLPQLTPNIKNARRVFLQSPRMTQSIGCCGRVWFVPYLVALWQWKVTDWWRIYIGDFSFNKNYPLPRPP